MKLNLEDDISLNILLEPTSKSVGSDVLFHLWADAAIDETMVKKIIKLGIENLSEADKEAIHNNYKEIWDLE